MTKVNNKNKVSNVSNQKRRGNRNRVNRPTRKSRQASTRVRAVNIPLVASGRISSFRPQRSELFSGSESIGAITLRSPDDKLFREGYPLMDMLISPRFVVAPLLNQKAQAWSNYRFTKLSFDFVSFLPSTVVGGVAYGLTRDVDAQIQDYLQFAKSCESSRTVPAAFGTTSISINCSPQLNKQRYFSTFSTSVSDCSQFRMVAAIAQALDAASVKIPVRIEVMMNYTVEFSGPVAPSVVFKALPDQAMDFDTDGKITGTGISPNRGEIYVVNPAIAYTEYGGTEILPPVVALATGKSTTDLYAYPTIEAAISGYDTIEPKNKILQLKLGSLTYVYKIMDRSLQPAAAVVAAQPAAELQQDSGPSLRDQELSRIMAHNASMMSLSSKLLSALRKLDVSDAVSSSAELAEEAVSDAPGAAL